MFAGLLKFQKAFFLHPDTDALYGRVDLQKGPLGAALYPLYYACNIGPAVVSGTLRKLMLRVELHMLAAFTAQYTES